MEQPLVSIGLPTYNGAKTLERSIESVLQQDYAHWELIISDNASLDGTQQICCKYSDQDKRVRCIRQPQNLGASQNFVEVLRHAQGEYFMWLADDDWLSDHFVSQGVAVLQENPDFVLASGRVNYFSGEELASHSHEISLDKEAPRQRVLDYYAHVNDNGMMYSLIRRRLLDETPLPRNIIGGDWLFMATLAFQGKFQINDMVCLNRSLGGTSESIQKIAASLGLNKLQAHHPYLCIAFFAFQEIAWASPIYHSLSAPARWRLGLKCAATIWHRYAWRFYFSAVLIRFVALTQRFASEQTYHRMRSVFRRVVPK